MRRVRPVAGSLGIAALCLFSAGFHCGDATQVKLGAAFELRGGEKVSVGGEVDPAWIRGVEAVGLTAGASAPEVLVEDVIAALARIRPVAVSILPGLEETISFRLPTELASV